LTIGEYNVVPSQSRIDESNNPFGLELGMVVVCNSNDDIPPNINWKFQWRGGGLDSFKIYIH
jgi:hypothetical protein